MLGIRISRIIVVFFSHFHLLILIYSLRLLLIHFISIRHTLAAPLLLPLQLYSFIKHITDLVLYKDTKNLGSKNTLRIIYVCEGMFLIIRLLKF